MHSLIVLGDEILFNNYFLQCVISFPLLESLIAY